MNETAWTKTRVAESYQVNVIIKNVKKMYLNIVTNVNSIKFVSYDMCWEVGGILHVNSFCCDAPQWSFEALSLIVHLIN